MDCSPICRWWRTSNHSCLACALGTLEAQTALVDEPPDIAGNNQLPHPPIFGGEWQTDCYLDTYVDYPPPARMTAGR